MPSWLHPAMSKEQSVELITQSGLSDGKFLVRKMPNSSSQHVLVVVYKGKPTHHLIAPGPEGNLLINKKSYGDGYDNLEDLIEGLSSGAKGWPVRLTDHVPSGDDDGGDDSDDNGDEGGMPWLYPASTTREESESLVAGKPDGTFLVRKRGGSSTEFVLTVVYKGKATQHLVKTGNGSPTINGKSYVATKTISGLIKGLGKKGVKGWPVPLTNPINCKDGGGSNAAEEAAAKKAEEARKAKAKEEEEAARKVREKEEAARKAKEAEQKAKEEEERKKAEAAAAAAAAKTKEEEEKVKAKEEEAAPPIPPRTDSSATDDVPPPIPARPPAQAATPATSAQPEPTPAHEPVPVAAAILPTAEPSTPAVQPISSAQPLAGDSMAAMSTASPIAGGPPADAALMQLSQSAQEAQARLEERRKLAEELQRQTRELQQQYQQYASMVTTMSPPTSPTTAATPVERSVSGGVGPISPQYSGTSSVMPGERRTSNRRTSRKPKEAWKDGKKTGWTEGRRDSLRRIRAKLNSTAGKPAPEKSEAKVVDSSGMYLTFGGFIERDGKYVHEVYGTTEA